VRQENDENAFRAFVLARTPALSRTTYLLTMDAQLAEELVRTGLLEAARDWRRIRDDPEPSVRRILATQNAPRRSREQASAEPDRELALEQALALLTARERTVLVLRYYEDLTEVQASDVLGISPRTVRSTTRQALDRLPTPEPELRDELYRIGETAPVADVADDTWVQARSSRRRDRTRVIAGAAAAVVLVAGLGAWITAGSDAPAPSDAVPDHIRHVPARALEDLETDLAIGRGSVTFMTPDGVPVVVGADQGDYHPLDLPGFSGRGELPLGLSPDGRQLAYAWAEPTAGGVRVVDLESGEIREIPIVDAVGTPVQWFRWSEDSRYLVWGGDAVAGLIPPGATTFVYLPTLPDDAHVSYAVSPEGAVAVVGDSTMMVVRNGRTTRTDLDVDQTVSVEASFSGEAVSDIRVANSGGGYWLYPNEPWADRLPLAEVPAGSVVTPLGRLDDTHVLARVASDLAVVGVGDDAELKVVGTLDPGVPPISVAAGLSSVEHPTADLPVRHWPWTTRQGRAILGVGVAVVLLAGATVLLLARRRRV
jgi:RNA polymerase sigma factor (sigma-70 family)